MKRNLLACICAATLMVSLLAGCGTEPLPEAEPLSAQPPVAQPVVYIPLDDRPVNGQRVTDLLLSLGYDPLMPSLDWTHTALDGQAKNTNGRQYGDRGSLLTWLSEQEAGGCNTYILSVDQLLSGGLVSSRSMGGGQPIPMPDGSTISEQAAMESILLPLLADESNTVYFLDTVMRLAPTVGYDGFDLDGYEALRTYGMEERPYDLTPETVEDVIASYPLDKAGYPLPHPGLTDAQIAQYHTSRARKLRQTDTLLAAVQNAKANAHYLLGVDDSAPWNSIQTQELFYLQSHLEKGNGLLSGADEIGMMAVCKLYQETSEYQPSVCVRYFGGMERQDSSEFNHLCLWQNVTEHLEYLDVPEVSVEDADLQVIVLTAPADEVTPKSAINDCIAALRQNQKYGVPTIFMDASKNVYGNAFQKKLIAKTDLGFLLGYGGFYDLANVSGVALSNGIARWLCLMESEPRSAEQETAFLRTLIDSQIKDLCYKTHTKVDIINYVKTIGGNPNNFTVDVTNQVDSQFGQAFPTACSDVLDNLAGSQYLCSLAPLTATTIGTVELTGFQFPWSRSFEITLDLHFANPRFVS